MQALYTLLAVGAVILIVSAVWRMAARRESLPCPVWLRWLVELDNPFAKVTRAASIAEHLELAPGMAVLDVGCGPGRVAIPIARKLEPPGEVVALDIQAGMLKRAEVKAKRAGVTNIRFVRAGAGEGAPERNHFDRALLVAVLGEIPERESALREIFAALKPGGIVSITEVAFDPHFQRRSTVRALAGGVGFRERAFFGNAFAFTLNFEKPAADAAPPWEAPSAAQP